MRTNAKRRSWSAVALSFALAAGTAACKDSDTDDVDPDDPVTTVERTTPPAATPPAAPADTSRSDYAAEARARLARLDARLSELRGRADAKAAQLSADLQVKRDALARQLDGAAAQAESGWEKFKTDVGRGFDELERDLDDALH